MMSSRAVAYLHQPRFRRPHGQLRSAPPSRRRRRCRHPPSRMKSWAVAGSYTRAAAQPAFSYDFSQVRIHTDSRAAQSAETIGASACTVGNHIAFDAGRHRPGAPQWVHLVAHELTRVVQQRGLDHRAGPVVGDPDDASGRETDFVASSLVPGRERAEKAGWWPGSPPYFPSPDGPAASAASGRPPTQAGADRVPGGCRPDMPCIKPCGVLKVAVEIVATRGPAVGAGTGLPRPRDELWPDPERHLERNAADDLLLRHERHRGWRRRSPTVSLASREPRADLAPGSRPEPGRRGAG